MARLLVALILALLIASPVRAEWRRAESANFILFSTESEARLRERVQLLEDFDRLLRTITSVNEPPTPNRLHVYIVDGPTALRTTRPIERGFAGYYIATPDGIAAFLDGRAQAGGNELLFHEYAHHFMRQYAPNAYPAWYSEGFAEYFATVRLRPRQIDFGDFSQGRIYSITQGEWLPAERVLFGQPNGLRREQMAAYYAQSWLITHYFYSTPERQTTLRRFLAAARQGEPQAALLTATGFTPDAFQDELRRYIRGGQIRFRRMTREPPAPAPVTVTTLPRSANELMLYEASLRIGITDEQQAGHLQGIRAAAARYPDDPFAMRVLAHAELRHGDGAVADRLLDRLIGGAPNDVELLYLKGLRHLLAAEHGTEWERDARIARDWFGRAHRADANHWQTLFRYSLSMRGQRSYVSENTSNILLLANQLAPQVAAITMNAAQLLLERRDFAQAEALLRPLAADPHNPELARAATEMRNRAVAGMAPAAQARPSPGN